MLDMLDFSLDQAIFRLPNGKLIRQMLGIPMGDALSPGMTIGTCGWMEREWMASLDDATKRNFMARRYMDDILLLMRKGGWDSQRFYEDLKTSGDRNATRGRWTWRRRATARSSKRISRWSTTVSSTA